MPRGRNDGYKYYLHLALLVLLSELVFYRESGIGILQRTEADLGMESGGEDLWEGAALGGPSGNSGEWDPWPDRVSDAVVSEGAIRNYLKPRGRDGLGLDSWRSPSAGRPPGGTPVSGMPFARAGIEPRSSTALAGAKKNVSTVQSAAPLLRDRALRRLPGEQSGRGSGARKYALRGEKTSRVNGKETVSREYPQRPSPSLQRIGMRGGLHRLGLESRRHWSDLEQWRLPLSKEIREFRNRRHARILHQKSAPRAKIENLQHLLGAGAIHPPPEHLVPPDLEELETRREDMEARLGIALREVRADEAERLRPPELSPDLLEAHEKESHLLGAHFDQFGVNQVAHESASWAVGLGDGWVPMARKGHYWWTWTGENRPLLWHQGHWWWKESGTWFLLHQSRPWAYQWFPQWEAEGLIQPDSGERILYSADASKAAIMAPGKDTVLFDLGTGRELRRWAPSVPRRIR